MNTLKSFPEIASTFERLLVGRRFMRRFRPIDTSPAGKLAARLIREVKEEAAPTPIHRKLMGWDVSNGDDSVAFTMGDLHCAQNAKLQHTVAAPGSRVTFTPEGGKPMEIVAKSFTIEPDHDTADVDAADPALTSAVMEHMFQFEFDKGFTTNAETGEDLPYEELMKKLTGPKRMVCGLVCNFMTVRRVRETVRRIEANAKTTWGFIPVYEKPGQIEGCFAFYDPKALAEYLAE